MSHFAVNSIVICLFYENDIAEFPFKPNNTSSDMNHCRMSNIDLPLPHNDLIIS